MSRNPLFSTELRNPTPSELRSHWRQLCREAERNVLSPYRLPDVDLYPWVTKTRHGVLQVKITRDRHCVTHAFVAWTRRRRDEDDGGHSLLVQIRIQRVQHGIRPSTGIDHNYRGGGVATPIVGPLASRYWNRQLALIVAIQDLTVARLKRLGVAREVRIAAVGTETPILLHTAASGVIYFAAEDAAYDVRAHRLTDVGVAIPIPHASPLLLRTSRKLHPQNLPETVQQMTTQFQVNRILALVGQVTPVAAREAPTRVLRIGLNDVSTDG